MRPTCVGTTPERRLAKVRYRSPAPVTSPISLGSVPEIDGLALLDEPWNDSELLSFVRRPTSVLIVPENAEPVGQKLVSSVSAPKSGRVPLS